VSLFLFFSQDFSPQIAQILALKAQGLSPFQVIQRGFTKEQCIEAGAQTCKNPVTDDSDDDPCNGVRIFVFLLFSF